MSSRPASAIGGVSPPRGVSPRELEAAYRRTRYRVSLPGGGAIELRIGQRSRAVDRVLAVCGYRHWAFVTAANPGSRPLPAWRNQARTQGLARTLVAAGFRALLGFGEPEQGGWIPEASFLVLGMTASRARRLGRQFQQNAIVAGRRGRAGALHWCHSRAARCSG